MTHNGVWVRLKPCNPPPSKYSIFLLLQCPWCVKGLYARHHSRVGLCFPINWVWPYQDTQLSLKSSYPPFHLPPRDQGEYYRYYFRVRIWLPLTFVGPSQTLLSIFYPFELILERIQCRLHLFGVFSLFWEDVFLFPYFCLENIHIDFCCYVLE